MKAELRFKGEKQEVDLKPGQVFYEMLEPIVLGEAKTHQKNEEATPEEMSYKRWLYELDVSEAQKTNQGEIIGLKLKEKSATLHWHSGHVYWGGILAG